MTMMHDDDANESLTVCRVGSLSEASSVSEGRRRYGTLLSCVEKRNWRKISRLGSRRLALPGATRLNSAPVVRPANGLVKAVGSISKNVSLVRSGCKAGSPASAF